MELDSFIFSSPGGREKNEDCAGERRFPGGGVFAIADGLGGHEDGEMASRAVCGALLSTLPTEGGEGGQWLLDRFTDANSAVRGLQTARGSDMKSTAAGLLIRDGRAYWCHAGDSRLYFFKSGDLASCTADHSVAYKKYRAGEISRAQIGQDEDQNRLLRCLGSPRPDRCVPDSGGSEVSAGDGFLMCTDGVWEYLLDGEILVDLLKSRDARTWGELLLQRVADRVGPDNDNLTLITILLR